MVIVCLGDYWPAGYVRQSESIGHRQSQTILLATYIEKNSKYFKKYLYKWNYGGIASEKIKGTWSNGVAHMELKAAAVIL